MAKIIAMVDDLDLKETGAKVEATVTRELSFGGESVELDLSPKHDDELAALLARYFAAGQRIAGRGRGKGRESTRGAGITSAKRSIAEKKALREWADGVGLSYLSPGGSVYYGKPLLEKWEAHLAEMGIDRASF